MSKWSICLALVFQLLLSQAMSACADAPDPQALVKSDLIIQVGEQYFPVTLQDNASTDALLDRLPLRITMDDLNGNEKYHNLSHPLPTDSERPGDIKTGDLMLYGNDCLVLFYASFTSAYRYTRLGSIADPAGLSDALGHGSVDIRIFKIDT